MTVPPAFTSGPRHRPTAMRQRGMTLVVSLIFLLILTILGVTAVNTSTLQQKMAGNMRDADMALQVAETGLRGGEARLMALYASGKPAADATGSSGVWLQGIPQTLNSGWWRAKSTPYNGSGTPLRLDTLPNPRYVLEESDFVEDTFTQRKYSAKPGVQYYKITSGAVGVSPASQAMIEDIYRVNSN